VSTGSLQRTPLPAQYRRAVITGPGSVTLDQVPLAEPTGRQVLVRVHASALCTWEQRVYTGVDSWSPPLLGGHEFAGVVAAVGDRAITEMSPGDPVAVSDLTRCGCCTSCRRGYDNLCDNRSKGRKPGTLWGPGGLSEYVLVEDYQVFGIDHSVSLLQAALAEPVACVLHDLRRHPPRSGATAVVAGAGFMGMLHIALLRTSGARVIVSEPDPARRATAIKHGAIVAIDPSQQDYVTAVKNLTGGRGADLTYVVTGEAHALEQAVLGAAKRGVVSAFATIWPRDTPVHIDANDLHHREITLSGSYAQDREDFLDAVALVATGDLGLSELISEVYPLDQLPEAFQAASRPDTYRIIVDPRSAASP
jgi:L-iditol 2-dehydrogenase